MRILIRLAVLALAAFGAKSIYEKLAPRKDTLRATGAEFMERTGSAAREVGAKVSDATQRVAATAQESAADLSVTARAQAGEVKAAAEEAKDKTLRDLDAAEAR